MTARQTFRWTAVILLLAFSCALRVFFLSRIPANFSGDEITQLGTQMELQYNKSNIFDLCFAGHHACFYTYMYMPFVFFIPNIVLAMRFPQAITSLAAVLLFFLIVKKQMSTKAAFLSSLLFSTSYWHLNFARSTWSNIFTVFLLLAGYWVYHFRDHMKSKYLILALTFVFLFLILGYPSGYLIVIFFLIYPFFQKAKAKTAKAVVLSFLLALLFSLPYLLFIINNPSKFLSRFTYTSVENNSRSYKTLLKLDTAPEIWLYQIKKATLGVLLALPTKSNFIESPRYYDENMGILDHCTRILFYLGVIVFFLRKKRDYFWLILLILGGFFTLLSQFPPNPARTLFTLPCYYHFIALFLHEVLKRANEIIKPLLIAACVAISLFNVFYYFSWITDQQTLSIRSPAIDIMEMERYLTFSKMKIDLYGTHATVNEWKYYKQTFSY